MPESSGSSTRFKRDFTSGLAQLARSRRHQPGQSLAVLFEGAAALSTSLGDAGPWAPEQVLIEPSGLNSSSQWMGIRPRSRCEMAGGRV